MDSHVKVSGAWKRTENIHVKVSSAWKQVQNAYVKVGGVWKQFYQLVVVVLSGGNGGTVNQGDGAGTPWDTIVGIRFNIDGSVETGTRKRGAAITWSAAGDWIDPTSAITGNEEVRFTNLVQNIDSTDWTVEAAIDDTWIGITTTRTWTSQKTNSGQRDFDCDFEVRDTGAGLGPTGSSYSFTMNNFS